MRKLVIIIIAISIGCMSLCQVAQADPKGIIYGYVYRDMNNNQVRDGGEPGISGITVNLTKKDSKTFFTQTVSGKGGYYNFTNMPSGKYSVGFNTDGTRWRAATVNEFSTELKMTGWDIEKSVDINFGVNPIRVIILRDGLPNKEEDKKLREWILDMFYKWFNRG